MLIVTSRTTNKTIQNGWIGYLLSKAPAFIISSISSLDGGSATAGTVFATPLGTHDTAAIILQFPATDLRMYLNIIFHKCIEATNPEIVKQARQIVKHLINIIFIMDWIFLLLDLRFYNFIYFLNINKKGLLIKFILYLFEIKEASDFNLTATDCLVFSPCCIIINKDHNRMGSQLYPTRPKLTISNRHNNNINNWTLIPNYLGFAMDPLSLFSSNRH